MILHCVLLPTRRSHAQANAKLLYNVPVSRPALPTSTIRKYLFADIFISGDSSSPIAPCAIRNACFCCGFGQFCICRALSPKTLNFLRFRQTIASDACYLHTNCVGTLLQRFNGNAFDTSPPKCGLAQFPNKVCRAVRRITSAAARSLKLRSWSEYEFSLGLNPICNLFLSSRNKKIVFSAPSTARHRFVLNLDHHRMQGKVNIIRHGFTAADCEQYCLSNVLSQVAAQRLKLHR